MPEPTDAAEARKHFLDVGDAEVVHGPDVIAEKVSGALKDADRFGLPHVKPPLSDALGKVQPSGATAAVDDEPAEQNALTGVSAEVDGSAGSSEVLKPAERTDRA